METTLSAHEYNRRFIEEKGGVEEVARLTGIGRQAVRFWWLKRSLPGSKMIMRLKEAFPDYMALGVVEKQESKPTFAEFEDVTSDPNEEIDLRAIADAALKAENDALKKQLASEKETNAFLKELIEDLRYEKSTLFAQLFPFDPTDPTPAGKRSRQQGVMPGKPWGNDLATDGGTTEESRKIGFRGTPFTEVTRNDIPFVAHKSSHSPAA